jgi:hypothetical protein
MIKTNTDNTIYLLLISKGWPIRYICIIFGGKSKQQTTDKQQQKMIEAALLLPALFSNPFCRDKGDGQYEEDFLALLYLLLLRSLAFGIDLPPSR